MATYTPAYRGEPRPSRVFAVVLLLACVAMIGGGVAEAGSLRHHQSHVVAANTVGAGSGVKGVTTKPTPSATPKTMTSSGTCTLGVAAHLVGSGGLSINVLVQPPQPHTSPLASFAYDPQHGYYLVFDTEISSNGTTQEVTSPSKDFIINAGAGNETIYSGNAPYSGSSNVLEPVPLGPSDPSESGDLVFDTASVHGTLIYRQAGLPTCTWHF